MFAISTVADLGNSVRTARHDRGLSQAELARRSGVSRAWLIRLEDGHPRAELVKVLAVLDTLGQRVEVRDETPTDSTDADHLRRLFGEIDD
ncbi:MAG: helix-turn-helix domain-containing protein [Aeromicrobium sp.]|uniref:helix-turn-helix domain-containing protein n=1 Tax=Aeromicrobium sp. TaxID=1871063 RepID=UPI0039E460ED